MFFVNLFHRTVEFYYRGTEKDQNFKIRLFFIWKGIKVLKKIRKKVLSPPSYAFGTLCLVFWFAVGQFYRWPILSVANSIGGQFCHRPVLIMASFTSITCIRGTEGLRFMNGTGPMIKNATTIQAFPIIETTVGYLSLSQTWKTKLRYRLLQIKTLGHFIWF